MPTTVNPQVILKGAQMARPDKEWIISVLGNVVETGKINYFDIMIYASDAWALERALKKDWRFSGYELPTAELIEYPSGKVKVKLHDPSDTLLLLRCVAAMHGLDLYVTPTRDVSGG